MPNPAFAYLCTDSHVDAAPSMGTYASCQHLIKVMSRRGLIGWAPCGKPVVPVPDPDGTLEASFRVGGVEAVQAVIRTRVADEAAPSAPHRG